MPDVLGASSSEAEDVVAAPVDVAPRREPCATRRAAKHTPRFSADLSDDASEDCDAADGQENLCYVCLGGKDDGDLSKRHRGVMIHRHCMAAIRAHSRLLKDDERRLRAVDKDPQLGREGYEVGISVWLYSCI